MLKLLIPSRFRARENKELVIDQLIDFSMTIWKLILFPVDFVKSSSKVRVASDWKEANFDLSNNLINEFTDYE